MSPPSFAPARQGPRAPAARPTGAERAAAPSAAARMLPYAVQRCACGAPAGQCACGGDEPSVQRAADPTAGGGGGAVPAHVRDLAGSGGGRPLDAQARAYFEPRLGAGLSHVRLHTGPAADASTRALGARAYAAGPHVAVREDAWSPGTPDGRRLLAHELAHTLQQSGRGTAPAPGVSRAGDPAEREAEAVAERAVARTDAARTESTESPSSGRSGATIDAVQRVAPELPGYSQEGDSCGAASLVSALMIWDRQRANPDAPNELVVTAANLVLTWMVQRRTVTIEGWNRKGMKGEELYKTVFDALTAVRESARLPGARLSEDEYRTIGLALYLLYVEKQAGLSAAAISSLQARLGLETTSRTSADKWDDIVATPELTGLKPGQIAQVFWYVKSGPANAQGQFPLTHHAFLIGRFPAGEWFLSDQGPRPPTELRAPDLKTLDLAIRVASRAGTSWILTGQPSMLIVGGWTGVRLLAGASGVEDKAAALVPKGKQLAEIDAGVTVTGQVLTAGDFVSRHYALGDASSVGTAGGGLLIVEMPQGVFSVYRTEAVSDDNLAATGIDEGDSAGMLLATKTFFHAWLRLCSANMCKAGLLKVY